MFPAENTDVELDAEEEVGDTEEAVRKRQENVFRFPKGKLRLLKTLCNLKKASKNNYDKYFLKKFKNRAVQAVLIS